MPTLSYADLIRQSRYPNDLRTQAFAGVIATGVAIDRRKLIRGMSEETFQQLLHCCFPGVALSNGSPRPGGNCLREFDEFDDLLALLLEHRVEPNELNDWLARCVATAAMDANHLWQDMGLPNRSALSCLLCEFFPALAELNVNDMKWKKFFYRQICERTGIVICKAPNCRVCTDHAVCFGPEEAMAHPVSIASRI